MVTFRECYEMTSPHKGFEFITQDHPQYTTGMFCEECNIDITKIFKSKQNVS